MTLSYIDPFAVPSTGSIDQRKVAIIAAYIARHRDGFSPNVLDPPMVAELTLVPAKSPRQRKPRYVPPDGLHTMAEAAQRLGCSIKTLKGHVASGALGYVALGHGKARPRRMFRPAHLDAFITAQTRKDSPCPSSATRARHTGASTSKSEVIAFSARPKSRPSGKPKK